MTNKHTPGPWRVAQLATDTPDAPGTEQKAVVVDEHNFAIVRLEKRDSAARDNANAALIAAAPELLESLNDLLRLVGEEFTIVRADGSKIVHPSVARAIAVRAKATGAQPC